MTMTKVLKKLEEEGNCPTETWDYEEIGVEIKGEVVNVKDWVNSQNVDAEIYEIIEKYGVIPPHLILPGAFMDLTEITKPGESLIDLFNAGERLSQIWENLPLKVREMYGFDKNEMLKDGGAKIVTAAEKTKIVAEKSLQEQLQEQLRLNEKLVEERKSTGPEKTEKTEESRR